MNDDSRHTDVLTEAQRNGQETTLETGLISRATGAIGLLAAGSILLYTSFVMLSDNGRIAGALLFLLSSALLIGAFHLLFRRT
jgi:hypothetical protein